MPDKKRMRKPLQALEQLRKEGSFDTETLTVLDGVIKDLSASLQP